MNNSLDEARRFLPLARDDAAAFQALSAMPHIRLALAFFHAQQALEKSLKAVLLTQGVVFRRTHDLFELADQLAQAGCALPVALDDLAGITPYAVEYRYGEEMLPGSDVAWVAQLLVVVLDWTQAQVGN